MAIFTCSQRTRDAAHKDGLAGIKRLRSIHHKIAVAQVPRTNLHLVSKSNKIRSPFPPIGKFCPCSFFSQRAGTAVPQSIFKDGYCYILCCFNHMCLQSNQSLALAVRHNEVILRYFHVGITIQTQKLHPSFKLLLFKCLKI